MIGCSRPESPTRWAAARTPVGPWYAAAWPRSTKPGRLLVIISARSGFEVLEAIRQNGSIAVNVTLPENYRSMSFVGNDAIVRGSGAAWRPLVDERHEAFREQLERYGIPPDYTNAWY